MKVKAVCFVAPWLAAFASLLANPLAASADEFRTPSISAVRVEWRAVLDQLRAEINSQPSIAANFTFASQRRVPSYDPRARPALVQLNAITSQLFPGIGRSPIPVLLPFDTATYLEARRSGTPDSLSMSRYQADFRPVDLFTAGAAGYDAMFALEPGAGNGMPERTYARPIEVHITGSLLLYDLNDRPGGKGEPVKSLSAQYPDIRRFIREGYVRYAFTRFGVPYVVSIHCLDSTPRLRRLACREAYPVAERFLKALRIAGGQPSRLRRDIASVSAERPAAISPEFTYRTSGDIVANSGYHKQGGRTDLTVYSQIRFPLAKAPAFIHSQSFGRRADQYPWQDSFCEARSFEVGQCANGFGHQGQDIRPGPCPRDNESGEPCDPKRQAIVAVRDGVVIRSRGQQGATLQVNTQTEHIRFRYMHMTPSAMDADSLLNGRRVTEGEKIGAVSNYLDHPNGTTRHLHFDVQVFTRDGWLWVNPYTTLVSAYERLIRGRGREIGPEPPAAAAVAHAQPEDVIQRLDPQEGGGN
ncbi:peptidoglycan DD-metalloendopeptidase family protein [Bradyrhizobium sp. Leo121]|uniref:peptidoglycan DD-metalloendopeptidase family protein n=1 Tax=Bradyrhizobium sp. Leo121 TaxID=1571195 RepID=UPI0010292F45|nr:peptidoglycan DD-metalloendopeptidase family protein [Bradyrhizobium sp. Leo121]RZN16759.1 peptidase M23 [Bradyrhizobium sp. Leo121]